MGEIFHACEKREPDCICNRCAHDTDDRVCCLGNIGYDCCPAKPGDCPYFEFSPERSDEPEAL